MYNAFSYPQIFYTLAFLAPLICFIVAFFKSSVQLKDFFYLYPSVYHLITQSRKIFRVGIYFFSISTIILANDFHKKSSIILKQNPLKKSKFYSFLLYVQTITAYITVTGGLGLVTYPENDAILFHFIMETIFFINILIFLILFDIMIKWLQDKAIYTVYVYNFLMTFVTLSYIIIRTIAIISNKDDQFLILSINEYLSFFVCLFKFPICGWEIQKNIQKNPQKYE